MPALDVDAAKRIALVIVIGAVVLALLAAKFVKAAVAKAIVILVLGGLVAVTFSQRSALSDCATDIRGKYADNDTSNTTCTFLGFDFTVTTLGGNLIVGESAGTSPPLALPADAGEQRADQLLGQLVRVGDMGKVAAPGQRHQLPGG